MSREYCVLSFKHFAVTRAQLVSASIIPRDLNLSHC